jgi:hypothetical protein
METVNSQQMLVRRSLFVVLRCTTRNGELRTRNEELRTRNIESRNYGIKKRGKLNTKYERRYTDFNRQTERILDSRSGDGHMDAR